MSPRETRATSRHRNRNSSQESIQSNKLSDSVERQRHSSAGSTRPQPKVQDNGTEFIDEDGI